MRHGGVYVLHSMLLFQFCLEVEDVHIIVTFSWSRGENGKLHTLLMAAVYIKIKQ